MLRQHAPDAKSFIQMKAYRYQPLSKDERARNRTKLKVCAKVEQVFWVFTRIFGFSQSALSRFGKEYQLALGHLWIDESLSRTATPPGQFLGESARQGSWSWSGCSGRVFLWRQRRNLGDACATVAGLSETGIGQRFLSTLSEFPMPSLSI